MVNKFPVVVPTTHVVGIAIVVAVITVLLTTYFMGGWAAQPSYTVWCDSTWHIVYGASPNGITGVANVKGC